MDIYRNNYRSAPIDALENTYERTARLAGRDAFRQAAILHVIEHPPTSWTLDLLGERRNPLLRPMGMLKLLLLSLDNGWLFWRDRERPVIRSMPESEAYCLETMQSGAAFGEICEHLAVGAGAKAGGQQAAAMLRN